MKRLLIIIAVAIVGSEAFSQAVVNIPDANFKAALLAESDINTNSDDEIQVTEAEAFGGTIYVLGKSIARLTGIEAFVNITDLICANNQLTTLDVSKNTKLTELYCFQNQLTTLDVSKNTELTTLYCSLNELKALNLKNGQNSKLVRFKISENDDLACVQVDNAADFKGKWQKDSDDVDIDPSIISEDCIVLVSRIDVAGEGAKDDIATKGGNLQMEVVVEPTGATDKAVGWSVASSSGSIGRATIDEDGLLTAVWDGTVIVTATARDGSGITGVKEITITNNPVPVVGILDDNFKAALLANRSINTNGDGEITVAEAEAFSGTIDVLSKNITRLTGIEAFVNITELNCGNNQLTTLDVSKNTKLTTLYCHQNQLTTLNLRNGHNSKLVRFTISGNDDLACVQVDDASVFKRKWQRDSGGEDINPSIISESCAQVSSISVKGAEDATTIDSKGGILQMEVEVGPTTALNKGVDWSVATSAGTSGGATIDEDGLLTAVWDGKVIVTATAKDESGITGTQEITITNNPSPVVGIPDDNFKAALLAIPGLNTNGDTEIQVAEAEAFSGTIDVNSKSIARLTGIEAFVNITELNCYRNDLTTLDVSKNTELTRLYCYRNQLTTLDVSKNTKLTELYCFQNQLTTLDVSKNTKLTELYCFQNQLTTLDVSKNTELTELYCDQNQLTTLNLKNGQNSKLVRFTISENDALACVQVDDAADFKGKWPEDSDDVAIDPSIISEDCIVLVSRIDVAGEGAKDDIATKGGNLQMEVVVEPTGATDKAVGWSVASSSGSIGRATIDEDGLLTAVWDGKVIVTATARDGSGITGTQEITITNNPVPVVKIPDPNFKAALLANRSINTNGDGEITVAEAEAFGGEIVVGAKDITSLKGIEAFVNITVLACFQNQLTTLDVSKNTKLTVLVCSDNELTTLDVSKNTKLAHLNCDQNQLTTLNLRNGQNSKLVRFIISENDDLACVQVDDAADFKRKWQEDSGDVAIEAGIISESCAQVSSIIVKGAEDATAIDSKGGILQMTVEVGPTTALNKGVGWSVATSAGTSGGATIDEDGLLTAVWDGKVIVTATARDGSGITATEEITITNNPSPVVDIPDDNFKAALLAIPGLNTNGDTEIQVAEAEAFGGEIVVGAKDITRLTGIEAFVNITRLECSRNDLTTLDVSKNTKLTRLNCGANELTTLDVSKNTELTELSCYNNPLTTLDVSKNTKLTGLYCHQNKLTTLDISKNTKLTELYCDQNQLTTLNLKNGQNSKLRIFTISENPALACIQVDDAAAFKRKWKRDSEREDINPGLISESCAQVSSISVKGAEDATTIDSKGGILQMEVEVGPTTALNKGVDWSVDPSSGSSGRATINEDGLLTALQDGKVTVTATAKDESGTTGTQEITITKNPLLVTSITVSGEGDKTNIEVKDGTLQMEVVVEPAGAANKGVDWSVDTSSGSSGRANINEDGLLTALQDGKVTVTATAKDESGTTGTQEITITNNPVPVVDIPDDNFKAALLADKAINTNSDTEIQVAEAEAFSGTIDVSSESITRLTGIEAFVNITRLDCYENQLTTLDVSQNTLLTTLDCSENKLTTLDVSKNTKLTSLDCDQNQLTTLNLRNGQNSKLERFKISGNDDLACVQVDNAADFKGKWQKDSESNNINPSLISESCAQVGTISVKGAEDATTIDSKDGNLQMTVEVLPTTALNKGVDWSVDPSADSKGRANINEDGLLTALQDGKVTVTATAKDESGTTGTQEITITKNPSLVVDIPDPNFKAALLAIPGLNTNGDTEIQVAEAEAFGGTIRVEQRGIGSLTGIEAFVNITDLNCYDNQLTTLDVSKNTKLTGLDCYDNQLTTLDVSKNTELTSLVCSINQLTTLDVSKNTKLTRLSCDKNQLTTLNLKNGNNNKLTHLSIAKNSALACIQVDDAADFKGKWQKDSVGEDINLGIISESCAQVSSIIVKGAEDATTIDSKGGILQMEVEVGPTTALNKGVDWSVDPSSGSSGRANINEDGLLTAVRDGKVTVTATAKDESGTTGTQEITITKNPLLVTSITVSGEGDKTNIEVKGGTLQMEVVVEPAGAANKDVAWSVASSSGSSGRANIDEDGLLTALQDGKVTVTATAEDGSGITATQEITITNNPLLVTGITVKSAGDVATIDIKEGTLVMTAEVEPSDATNTNVSWSVDDESKATIDATTGVLTPKSTGMVRVTATAEDAGGAMGTKQITITDAIDPSSVKQITGITVKSAGNVSTIDIKEGTLKMTVDLEPSDATNTNVRWSVDDESKATIDAITGLLTLKSAGMVRVTATAEDAGGVTGTKDITITKEVESITVKSAGDVSTIDIREGTLLMTVEVEPSDATNTNVSWSVDDESKATIDATTGVLTPKSTGMVRVTATAEDAGGVTGTKQITITDAIDPSSVKQITGITVKSAGNVSTIDIREGTLKMTVDLEPSDPTNTNVRWSVDDESKATIDAITGVLKLKSTGMVRVTATSEDAGGVTGTKQITITDNPEPVVTGIAEDAAEEQLMIYPNPASDIVIIKATDRIVESVTIQDLTGTIVKVIEKDIHSVDISSLRSGTYLLCVKTATGIIFSKFLKINP